MKKRELAAAIRATVKRILQYGWRNGGGLGAEGERCLGGHFCLIANERRMWVGWDKLMALFQPSGQSVTTWNDAPGRTVEQVISVLRSMAYALEHGGKDRKGNLYVVPQ